FLMSSTINMLGDNILIELNGIVSIWDTYCLNLDISGRKGLASARALCPLPEYMPHISE
ncbi:hypothetical protein CY34DRAFT_95393, partial [Suillus luteus UH-Slu-Lm8-n1]